VYQTLKEKGESVHANEVIALLGTPGRPLIRLAVDQQDIDRTRPGQQVLLQTDATGNRIFEATVSCIYHVMNEMDQTFRVDARFTGPTPPTFIHSQVEANIIVQKKQKALVLPRTAFAAKDSLWVYENGKEKEIFVQTGISTLDYVEIIAGIDEHTPVRAAGKINNR
jgi:multidrug efflux pump subunit AcrA (membrane-fusion protein)